MPQFLIGKPLTLVAKTAGRFVLLGPDGGSLLNGTVGEPANGRMAGESISVFVSELRADTDDIFHLQRQSRLKATEAPKQSLSISEKGKGSGMLAITREGDSPEVVTETLNEIAKVYVRQNVERRSAEAEQTLAFLDGQLPIVRQDMETAEGALNVYRLEKGSIDLPLETRAILETIVTVEGQPSADINRFVGTITSAGSQTIANAGIMDASSNGNLILHSNFAGVGLSSGDKIEFTFTLEQT